MVSLSFIYIRKLEDAIAKGSCHDIVENLRILAGRFGQAIPAEIALKLSDYLDPNRPSIRSGPKKKHFHDKSYDIAEDYLHLCEDENSAFARYVVDCDMINTPIRDQDWPREQLKILKPPLRGDIRGKVCELYSISERTFDTILADHNIALAINYYTNLVNDHYDPEIAKQMACKNYKIKVAKFEKAYPQ